MDQIEKDKQREVMPKSLTRGLGKYFNKDEGLSVNMKIMIIIGIFSLILIFIGTIILLNSYNPKATSLTNIKERDNIAQQNGIVVSGSTEKPVTLSLESKISDFTDSLSSDESNFENSSQ